MRGAGRLADLRAREGTGAAGRLALEGFGTVGRGRARGGGGLAG